MMEVKMQPTQRVVKMRTGATHVAPRCGYKITSQYGFGGDSEVLTVGSVRVMETIGIFTAVKMIV